MAAIFLSNQGEKSKATPGQPLEWTFGAVMGHNALGLLCTITKGWIFKKGNGYHIYGIVGYVGSVNGCIEMSCTT